MLTTWDAFIIALETRFGPSSYDNHEAAIYKLKQTGYVLDFQQHFELVSNRVTGLSPTSLLNYFLSGLKPEIARELSILKPTTLYHAIDLAKLVEAKINDSKPHFTKQPRNNTNITTQNLPSILGAPTNLTPLPHPVKRLTVAEQQERRSKGLYDTTNTNDETETNIEQENHTVNSPSLLNDIESPTGEHFHLSPAALRGSPSPKTLRLKGHIQQMEVTVLIDSGISHNILQPRIAEFLELPVNVIPPFAVIVGNGQSITCEGACAEVPVILAK
ncbi:hypothetical protein KIW84_052749 [Lathyrus oleraceus]|uniref:Ty3 transposon capsid-like protein domain-containing protein n=1 Tax=Pisum sativum TaxID=3888 RepID=A0A9D5ACD3_PEA|nr:hypothetical protein KIW84_052749 [Pisum sativum]